MDKLEFLEMNQNEIEESGELAASAFEDYEYMTTYVSDMKKCKNFVHIATPIDVKVNTDAVRLIAKSGDKIVAVATLFPPGVSRVGDIEYIKAGMIKAYFAGGVLDVDAWVNMDKKAGVPCHSLKGNIWYLNLLTVDPSFQGKGVGSEFINDGIVPYVKNHGGEKLCLFTNSEKNKKFYEKNGFEVFDYREFYYKGRTLPSYSFIKTL